MYERMLERQAEPSYEDMAAWCGTCKTLFDDFNTALTQHYGTQTRIRFPYGRRYGWGVDHRLKNKHIVDVFPEKDAFTVMLRLSDAQFMAVYAELLLETRALIDQRYPSGDGGWIHLRVTDLLQMGDALRLMNEKCKGNRADEGQ